MASLVRVRNVREVRQFYERLPRFIIAPGTARGLNKATGNVRTAASRGIRDRRSLPASTVRKAMDVRRATRNDLTSALTVSGRPIPLKDYKARQTRKGVTVSVTPGARKLVRHEGNAAFIILSRDGHVYARTGKERFPIKKLFGPSLPATFVQQNVREAWLSVAKDAIPKRVSEEVNFELSKFTKRRAR